jgi:UDP-GlcNAc:undecaprenyl-phosphate/decaprenyl-phosphate GlcNAc-1-phosphate transferase
MILPLLTLCGVSFVLSLVGTFLVRRVAIRAGFVDKPGHRKIHSKPVALGGGVAIFLAFALPMAAAVVLANIGFPLLGQASSPAVEELNAAKIGGIQMQTPLALSFLGACLALHLMGLWDDRKAMGPYSKLFVQLGVATALVLLNPSLRALTALGVVPSVVLTVLWITAVTNAFNFLDNMDGLSAGVACVCAVAFFVAAATIGQWFVAASLALLIGALLGFLCFNFPPASIFMGDSGSLVIGFILGVLTIRTTYLPAGEDFGAGWYAVFVPVIVLAVPLYDLIVVSLIRISRGVSPFKGDTNHFSHRLVARGMSRRTAVLCLYLISAATAVGAIVLPHAQSAFVAVLVFVQTLLILGVVALLEQHPLPVRADTKQEEGQPQRHRGTEAAAEIPKELQESRASDL